MAAVFTVFGLAIGSLRIRDNSTFVHIRTGMDLVAGLGIPRADPYSFTAQGHDWVVQSWLPSLTYGWAERWGGFGWIAAWNGVLVALLAWLVTRICRSGSTARTIAAAGIAIGAGAPFWAPRPLLFGLIAFALTVLVVERRAHPVWLVPIVWLWVNSHGSFPLGALWLAALAVGAALDARGLPRRELRYVGGFLVGIIVAALNPIGPRLLWFPLIVGDKRSVFRTVAEWQSPDFQTPHGVFGLTFLALALVVLFRHRCPWRDIIPVAGFIALGLLAMRNLAPMTIVLAPALRRSVAPSEPVVGARQPFNRIIAAVLAFVAVLITVSAASGAGLRTKPYPVQAVTRLERQGYLEAPHHIAHQDAVGCYLDLRYGRKARVFIDDRVDMFPVRVSEDYRELLRGRPRSLRILDRYKIDAVLWEDDQPLVSILKADGGWRQTFHRDGWIVLVRG